MNNLANFMRCAIAEAGGDRAPMPIKSSRTRRRPSQPATYAKKRRARNCESARNRWRPNPTRESGAIERWPVH